MNGPNRLTTLLPLLLAAGVVCCHNKCEKSSETIAPLNSKRQLSLKNSKKKKSRLPPPLPELLVGNSIREKKREEREGKKDFTQCPVATAQDSEQAKASSSSSIDNDRFG